jgi:hypothetical protein
MKNFIYNNDWFFSIGIPVSILIAIFISLFYFTKDSDIQVQDMSQEDRIRFEARCTNISGSRPACWKSEDWEVFFIEYCKRASCKE